MEENLLADILQKNQSEVFAMLLTEYDEKKYEAALSGRLRKGRAGRLTGAAGNAGPQKITARERRRHHCRRAGDGGRHH